jgi:Abortive infection C-terminus
MSFYNNCIYKELPRSPEQLPANMTKLASALFAGGTGMSGPQIFDFFSRFSEDIAKMRYGSGAPSRWQMFENFLESLPAEVQRQVLIELCDRPMRTPPPVDEVVRLRDMLHGVPIPSTMVAAVEKIDSLYVQKQWEKLSRRLARDPEGAITSARTLLETVCLYILDVRHRNVEYKGDLTQLYKVVAEELKIAPQKEDSAVIKQILGSCSGLVQGVATIRNQFGDAHGRLSDDSYRHIAHLAANAAGTLAVFLVECLNSKQ